MSRLAGFPTGLLSLLQSQSFGEAPKEMADAIAPTVELAELYLLTQQVAAIGSVALPANGVNVALTVPQGEVWRVAYGGAFCLTGAGTTCDITPIVGVDGGTVPLGNTISLAASQMRFMPSLMGPMWLKAGQTLGAHINLLVGANISVSVSYAVSRLRA